MGTAFRLWSAAMLPLALGSIGCAEQPTNPSFPVSIQEASRDLKRMADEPRRLDRPLVIVTGFLDPGFAALSLRMRFDGLTHDQRIIAISLAERMSFESCQSKLIDAVDDRFPSGDAGQTSEVDVIGYSLGGLVARYAALPQTDGKTRRLRIARLFTISSPHRGADDANRLPLLHPLQKHLRAGSALLAKVNAAEADYLIVPYVRLSDRPVGVANAAPPGRIPWWVPTPALSDPHNGAFNDERILADIARRLRGENPLTREPPERLP